MTTTDRMPNLDSRRETTDRVGETVILGNSIGSAALSAIAQIVMGAAGESRASVNMLMPASATIDWTNGSFGVWAVYLDIDTTASLALGGASIGSGRFNDIAAGLLSWGADAMLLNIRVFTATGAYTPTTGTAQIVVFALGAGGGGGGCGATSGTQAAAGGGGGAGAMAMGRITSAFSGVTITIGAGGAGGVGSNPGASGGDTSFGTLLIGGGGGGGAQDPGSVAPNAANGGTGGSASGSSSLFGARGESGRQGYFDSLTLANQGGGGNSAYGSGGIGAHSTLGTIGNAGTGFGGGGSGAANGVSAASKTGGAGSAGICIVYEYNA